MAQRKRCFHKPLRVSGIKIHTNAFGSKRTSQPARCNFQVTSISSVSIFGDQYPTSCTALLRNAVITPDTVNKRPKVLCARLIMPTIEENSPTWIRPSKVERVRIRGFPVTAATEGLAWKWRIIHWAA